jgi:O-acetyl-ADP-ribose deacetylase (regulator of RNase III)
MEDFKVIIDQVQFHLIDTNNEIVQQWKEYFKNNPNFHFYLGDIFSVLPEFKEPTAIVSPANSFGDMRGGIDLAYLNFFGFNLEGKLRKTIGTYKFGEVIVGDSLVIDIPTPKKNIRYLISAPTMRVPMEIKNTINVYLAFRAVLIAIYEFNKKNNHPIKHVICPGLGTGVGNMSEDICVKQMYQAYKTMTEIQEEQSLNKKAFEQKKLIS